jgi:hypothetical protein
VGKKAAEGRVAVEKKMAGFTETELNIIIIIMRRRRRRRRRAAMGGGLAIAAWSAAIWDSTAERVRWTMVSRPSGTPTPS